MYNQLILNLSIIDLCLSNGVFPAQRTELMRDSLAMLVSLWQQVAGEKYNKKNTIVIENILNYCASKIISAQIQSNALFIRQACALINILKAHS